MAESPEIARIAQLESDVARLRRLLDERNAPAELRHRQRNTLALLRSVMRQSAETRTDLKSYVAHLEDRLDTIARVQKAIDQSGRVDLYSLVSDELLFYAAREGEQFTLSGPRVLLQPRAGQALALAVHELCVNAVEHGALSVSSGRVDVSWQVDHPPEGAALVTTWKETGLGGVTDPTRRGFGTEVLTETLAHEVNASIELAYEADGLRCRMVLPFPDWIGRVADDEDRPPS